MTTPDPKQLARELRPFDNIDAYELDDQESIGKLRALCDAVLAGQGDAGLRELRDACYAIGRPTRLIQNAVDFVAVVNEIDRLLAAPPKAEEVPHSVDESYRRGLSKLLDARDDLIAARDAEIARLKEQLHAREQTLSAHLETMAAVADAADARFKCMWPDLPKFVAPKAKLAEAEKQLAAAKAEGRKLAVSELRAMSDRLLKSADVNKASGDSIRASAQRDAAWECRGAADALEAPDAAQPDGVPPYEGDPRDCAFTKPQQGERYVDFLQRMCRYFGGPIAPRTIHHVEIREVKRKAKRKGGKS